MENNLKAGDLVQYWIEGTIYNALVVGSTHEPYLNLIYIDPERGVIRVGAVELTEGKTTGFVIPIQEIERLKEELFLRGDELRRMTECRDDLRRLIAQLREKGTQVYSPYSISVW